MDELKRKIKDSGLQKKYLAEKIGISPAHFSMMLNGNATMPEQTRNKLNVILNKVLQVNV
jgi:DNA transposition AAA+ family ATPase